MGSNAGTLAASLHEVNERIGGTCTDTGKPLLASGDAGDELSLLGIEVTHQ
jgi:hypothetical protein